MKTLNFSAVTAKLTSVVNATSEDGLQELLAHMVYHALVHGNVALKQLASLRDSKANGKFKSAVAKYMPIKYVKGTAGKPGHYIFDGKKSLELRAELEVVQSGVTGQEPSSLEEVASKLPSIFEKVEREAHVFDADKSIKALLDRLNNNGATEEAAVLADAYNGLLLARATKAMAA